MTGRAPLGAPSPLRPAEAWAKHESVMMMKWLGMTMGLLLIGSSVFAETVHLRTGEAIRGKIVRADNDTISIESEQGFGVLQIKKDEVVLIEFDEPAEGRERRIGIGYYHRSQPNTVSGQLAEFGVDAMSLKFWLSDTASLDLQLGYFSTTSDGDPLLEVFSLDVRYATVVQRRGLLDVYVGGSYGLITVEDNTGGAEFSESGTTLRGFVGVELFFATLPGLGISSELGIGMQELGDRSTTNLSTTTFPAFSIRYYY